MLTTQSNPTPVLTPAVDDFRVEAEPFYLPVADEADIFEAAHRARIPVLLKGPTGCGKTRFVAHMAHKLNLPLITVACHEDLTASDLVGRYLLHGDQTVWVDGPLTTAVRHGGILYLDEVVEARKDTIVVIHPLTDHRRELSIEKLAQIVRAPPNFMLVVSYNPGYQSVLKELKQSTRQRFVALDFNYPPPEVEESVVAAEAGIDRDVAKRLVKVASKVRNLTSRGLEEGVSTRLVVHAARLISEGITPRAATAAAFERALADDPDLQASIRQVVADFF
jgi:nitric oxide reductase NorQ protein